MLYEPFQLQPFFTGRNEEFRVLLNLLTEPLSIVVIKGYQGVGKTQLAIEFASRYHHIFEGGVYIINMSDERVLADEISRFAKYFKIDMDLNTKNKAELVKQEWQKPISSLLIFDNCEDITLLKKWLPISHKTGARILITNCYIDWAKYSNWNPYKEPQIVDLDVLSDNESIQFLKDFTHLPINNAEAHQIVTALGHLPLALLGGASYLIKKQPLTSNEYIDLLSNQQNRDRAIAYIHPENIYQEPIDKAYELNYQEFLSESIELKIWLIAFIACSSSNYFVPTNFIQKCLSRILKIDWLDITNRVAFTDILDILYNFSFIKTQKNNNIYVSVKSHLLIIDFFKKKVGSEKFDFALNIFIDELIDKITESTEKELMNFSDLLPHLAFWSKKELPQQGAILSYIGYYLCLQDQYNNAVEYCQKALNLDKVKFGEDSPEVGRDYYHLGEIFRRQEKFEDAYNYLKEAIRIGELKNQHPGKISLYLRSMGAWFETAKNDYTEAKIYYERAFEISEAIYGLDERTSIILNNLMIVYGKSDKQEDLAQAENFGLQALKGRSQEDVYYAKILVNLGNLAVGLAFQSKEEKEKQLNFKRAKKHYHKALNIFTNIYGKEHLLVVKSMTNVGYSYHMMRQFKYALSHYKQALDISKKLLENEDDIELANLICNIGEVYIQWADTQGEKNTLQNGNYKKGVEHLKHAFHIKYKQHQMDLIQLGYELEQLIAAYQKLGWQQNIDELIKQIEKEIAVFDEEQFLDNLKELLNIYKRLGMNDNLTQLIEKVDIGFPNLGESWQELKEAIWADDKNSDEAKAE